MAGSRWFLPLMAASGVALSLTAPLEVLFIRDRSGSSLYIGLFMLVSGLGVVVVDVFGTRFVPRLDARVALAVGLSVFGVACIGLGVAPDGVLLMSSRLLQGFGGGMMLGAGLQAAVRVRPAAGDPAHALGRFNAAFLFGGAVGSPGGLLVAGLVAGRAGYLIAFVVTGALALVIAAVLATALPRLAAPAGPPGPRIGLPRFAKVPASGAALVLAMSGEFLRGGVLLTALPLAGAARAYSTITISLAIALMSGVEIAVLTVAYRIIARVGVVAVLIASFALGALCAALLAVTAGAATYLAVSLLFGVCLAGATASLPVLVVAQVGDSAAGLAKFRISAGVGILAGSFGCSVLGVAIGPAGLFFLIALVLLGSLQLACFVGRRMAGNRVIGVISDVRSPLTIACSPREMRPRPARPVPPEVIYQRQRTTPDRMNNSLRRAYDLLRSALVTSDGNMFLVEGELTDALSASRNTVRAVLQQLAREGLVTRGPKNGTRAAGSLLLRIDELSPVAQFGNGSAARVRARTLECRALGCPPLVRERLRLPARCTVLMTEALLLQDDVPLGLSVSYVALDDELPAGFDVEEPDVIVILERQLGVRVKGSRTMVGAVAADEQTAELVGLEVGAPMIWLEDIIEDEDGQPRALSQLRLRSDRIAFSATAYRSA